MSDYDLSKLPAQYVFDLPALADFAGFIGGKLLEHCAVEPTEEHIDAVVKALYEFISSELDQIEAKAFASAVLGDLKELPTTEEQPAHRSEFDL